MEQLEISSLLLLKWCSSAIVFKKNLIIKACYFTQIYVLQLYLCLSSLNEELCYILSTQNNCWEVFASDGIYLQSFHWSLFKMPVCNTSCFNKLIIFLINHIFKNILTRKKLRWGVALNVRNEIFYGPLCAEKL